MKVAALATENQSFETENARQISGDLTCLPPVRLRPGGAFTNIRHNNKIQPPLHCTRLNSNRQVFRMLSGVPHFTNTWDRVANGTTATGIELCLTSTKVLSQLAFLSSTTSNSPLALNKSASGSVRQGKIFLPAAPCVFISFFSF